MLHKFILMVFWWSTISTGQLVSISSPGTDSDEKSSGEIPRPSHFPGHIENEFNTFANMNVTSSAFLWTQQAESYTWQGRSLNGHGILMFRSKNNSNQCALECMKYQLCQSFNFDHATKFCELNNVTHLDFPKDFIDAKTREYHTKNAFSVEKNITPSLVKEYLYMSTPRTSASLPKMSTKIIM